MTLYLSIKERIERRFVALVQGISAAPIGTIHRWDSRGIPRRRVDDEDETFAHLDGVVIAGDDAADEGPTGDVGLTHWLLPIGVYVRLIQPEDDDDSTSQVRNRYQALIEQAIYADRELTDDNGDRLAIDVRVTGKPGVLQIGDEVLVTAGVVFEVLYRTISGSPEKTDGSTDVEET